MEVVIHSLPETVFWCVKLVGNCVFDARGAENDILMPQVCERIAILIFPGKDFAGSNDCVEKGCGFVIQFLKKRKEEYLMRNTMHNYFINLRQKAPQAIAPTIVAALIFLITYFCFGAGNSMIAVTAPRSSSP